METFLWLLREAARLLGAGKSAEPARPHEATAADTRVYTAYWDEGKIDWALDLIETRLRDSRPLADAHLGYLQTFLFNARVAFPRFTERIGRSETALRHGRDGDKM